MSNIRQLIFTVDDSEIKQSSLHDLFDLYLLKGRVFRVRCLLGCTEVDYRTTMEGEQGIPISSACDQPDYSGKQSKNEVGSPATMNLIVETSVSEDKEASVIVNQPELQVPNHLRNNHNETVSEQEEFLSKLLNNLEESEAQRWLGWAEIENDPAIFTDLVRNWGMDCIEVRDVFDLTAISGESNTNILGLIFLSRWISSSLRLSSKTSDLMTPVPASSISPPWFTNQISKFSCGTVALMNILLNCSSDQVPLSQDLASFKAATLDQTSKQRGLTLDSHTTVRNAHNVYSTYLDRRIVDWMLHKDYKASQNRNRAALKRKSKAKFTRRKKKKTSNDEDDNGHHFVAYIPSGNTVWKLDGLQKDPELVRTISEGENWRQVAAADLAQQMELVENNGYGCSIMAVTCVGENKSCDPMEKAEKEDGMLKEREDWAPFIENVIRIHARKGTLGDMLEL